MVLIDNALSHPRVLKEMCKEICWCCFSVAKMWTTAGQASLSFTISQSLLKLMPTKLVMPSNHLILATNILSKWEQALNPYLCAETALFKGHGTQLDAHLHSAFSQVQTGWWAEQWETDSINFFANKKCKK